MILTNKEIMDFVGLNIADKKLPIRLSYALAINVEEMKSAMKIYNEHYTSLIQEHAEIDKESNTYKIIDGHFVFKDQEAWNHDIQELLNSTVDLNIAQVPVSILEKCEDGDFDTLSVSEVIAMKFMLDDAI